MFYIQKSGECVSQVYGVKADSWENAKRMAWEELDEGDVLAECETDAIEADQDGYHSVAEEKCANYASLERGAWVLTKSGEEDFRKDIWYFSDDTEEYLDANGNPYNFDSL